MHAFTMFILCLPVSLGFPQCVMSPSPKQTETAPVKIEIDKVSLAAVSREGIQLSVWLSMTASQGAKAHQLSFENVRLNGMPIYVAPVTSPLILRKEQRIPFPLPNVNIYYGDLASLRPLARMLSEGQIRLDGAARVDLEVQWFKRFILFARDVRLAVNIDQAVRLDLPGGETMRKGAISAVEAAGKVIETARSGLKTGLALTSPWYRRLWRESVPKLLLAQARLTLGSGAGNMVSLECTGVGFRISQRQFLLTKQLIEPWKFNPGIAAAIDQGRLKIGAKDFDFWVWPASGKQQEAKDGSFSDGALRLSRGDVRIVREPTDERETVFSAGLLHGIEKVRVHQRASPANLALLEFAEGIELEPVETTKVGAEKAEMAWDELAVFRFPGGLNLLNADPDLTFVQGVKGGTRIRLLSPVDASAVGSPLISQGGVVGILQNEQSALVLEEAYRILRVKAY